MKVKANSEEKKENFIWELCIVTAFKNIQLNYVDNPQIPAWGLAIKPSNNGIDVQKAYRPENGGRLVFNAQTYKNENGVEVSGKAIVVMAGTLNKTASVWSVSSEGIPSGSFSMQDFGIVDANFTHFMGRGFGSGIASDKPAGNSGSEVKPN